MSRQPKTVSVVVPIFNESGNLHTLHAHLRRVIGQRDEQFEILFVDDGSDDGSFDIIERLHAEDSRVRAIQLSRNFGHQAALTAGLDHAIGDAVISMDGDLQHPPEVIPEMLARWYEGHEIVHTVREASVGVGAWKGASSALYYRLMEWIGDVGIRPGTADFRLLDRRAVEALRQMPERTRFLRGMVPWLGFRQADVQYHAAPRHSGTGKYTTLKMLRFGLDGVTSFSPLPLRLATLLGAVTAIVSIAYLVFAVHAVLVVGNVVRGWASVLGAVLLLGSIQLLTIGILGEYLYKIYLETKGRPHYLVRRRL